MIQTIKPRMKAAAGTGTMPFVRPFRLAGSPPTFQNAWRAMTCLRLAKLSRSIEHPPAMAKTKTTRGHPQNALGWDSSTHTRCSVFGPQHYHRLQWYRNMSRRATNTKKRRRETKRRKPSNKKMETKMKKQQIQRQVPTHGPTGRPVMTEANWHNDAFVASLQLDMNTNHPKNILHNNTQDKLQYTQQIKYTAAGPQHEQMFMATTTTTFGKGVIRNYQNNSNAPEESNNQIKLVCSGLGRTKKWAEFYAAVDLIAALKQECGIDAKNPPDMKAMRQIQEKEQFKLKLVRAQMMLELLGCSSRPHFEIARNKNRWVAEVSLWIRGVYLTAKGPPGKTKAKAEGLALLELANGQELADLVNHDPHNKNSMEQYEALIDESPGKHVASLQIPALPEDVTENLVEAVGIFNEELTEAIEIYQSKHELRMNEQARVKEEFEKKNLRHHHHPMRNNRNRRRRRSRKRLEFINQGLRDEEIRKEEIIARNPNGEQGQMKAIREALPITKIREDLLNALRTEQVVVVSGGTGSGKSTQCPQYILEDAILSGYGADTEIIVTQPRKIAAISVAERVAAERDESVGQSVGYAVRFQRKAPREAGGTIEFVTTGVLLRRLVNDPTLEGVSCVMIDEVHERDINTDFLLILLRDLLGGERPDLRVVLMSATLDADSFANYFSSPPTQEMEALGQQQHNCPVQVLSVPTEPRHPVEIFYLEDMALSSFPVEIQGLAESLLQYNDEKLRTELEEAESEVSAAAQLEARAHAEDEGLSLLERDSSDEDYYNSDRENGSDNDGCIDSERQPASRIETLKHDFSLKRHSNANSTSKLMNVNHYNSNATHMRRKQEREAEDSIVRLVAELALYLSKFETDSGRKGSILCFLPGWDEIKEVTSLLGTEDDTLLKNKMRVLPLHSTIPQEDQQKVFKPAKDGTVKVILATNIAESSVTINDVLAVIDGGLVRQMNWDAESAMSNMETVPTSRASAIQRLGRAGRVAPGQCYRLYSRGAFEAMAARPAPEIQRTALEATCLQTCSMTRDGVEKFLGKAMDPPQEDAVSYAVDRLVKLGALHINVGTPGSGEVLTPLGRCLSRLPLDPAMGRMLIMGVVMRCLDPILTTAAIFSSRNTFYNPPGMRDEAREIRKSFSCSSDIMAQVRAYNQFWCIVENEGGWNDACSWARENYVSISALVSMKAVRSQLLEELKKIGLVDSTDLEKVGFKKYALRGDAVLNRNANNETLQIAVWATGLPGNLSSRRQLGSFGTLRTRMDNHTGLHPSSVSFHRKPPRGQLKLPSWYLYREMVLSSQVFLRECTAMTPEQVLLFGGYSLASLKNQHPAIDRATNPIYVLDNWIVVESSCDDTMRLLTSARQDINAALEYKVMNPRNPLPDELQSVIDSICDMFEELYVESPTVENGYYD